MFRIAAGPCNFAGGHAGSNTPGLFRPPKLSGAGPGGAREDLRVLPAVFDLLNAIFVYRCIVFSVLLRLYPLTNLPKTLSIDQVGTLPLHRCTILLPKPPRREPETGTPKAETSNIEFDKCKMCHLCKAITTVHCCILTIRTHRRSMICWRWHPDTYTSRLRNSLTLAGLEPAMFGPEDQRLIH